MIFFQNKGEEAGKMLLTNLEKKYICNSYNNTRYEKNNFCSSCCTYHYCL